MLSRCRTRLDFTKINIYKEDYYAEESKKGFFLTASIAIIGLAVIYFSNTFLNSLAMSFFSIGIVVLTTLPIQIRKKKQRKLIADYLPRIDTTLQENIYEATQVTLKQLKNYTVLGTGIASFKLYKIEEIISKM